MDTIDLHIDVKVKADFAVHKGQMNTHKCEAGEWWGETICESFSMDDSLKSIKLPDGEYSVEIIIKKVN
jgi:hypothetical protein